MQKTPSHVYSTWVTRKEERKCEAESGAVDERSLKQSITG